MVHQTHHLNYQAHLCFITYMILKSKKKKKQKQNKTKQKTKQNKTKQNKTKQNKTKQNKTKQNKTKQNKTKQKQKQKQNKSKQKNKKTKTYYPQGQSNRPTELKMLWLYNFSFRGNCTSNQNWACFLHYFKFINTVLKNDTNMISILK